MDPVEVPWLVDLLTDFIHLFFILSVVHHIVTVLRHHHLLEWLFELSQNFVNFGQIDLLSKSLLAPGQEAVSDPLHVADLGIEAIRLVLVEVVVGVLQDGADGGDGEAGVLFSAQVVLTHRIVQKI